MYYDTAEIYTYYRLTIGSKNTKKVESSVLLNIGNIFANFLLQINCYEISPANNSDA